MIKTLHPMRPGFFRRLSATALSLAVAFVSTAQYCAPAVNSSGLYFNSVRFDASDRITNGVQYNTSSNGYSQTVGSSSGTVHRYFGGGIFYGIANSVAGIKNYRVKLFVDWNNDGDFNDYMEDNNTGNGTAPEGTGIEMRSPLVTASTVRVRLALAEGTTPPTACGSFTGEVEDYTLTIAPNNAPVLNPAAAPVINSLLTSQTAPEGFTIQQFINSTIPDAPLASDADDHTTENVPRGLAIIGQSAANGRWQYRAGSGAWTDFGAVAPGNALLLLGDASRLADPPECRIRFVPTGAGTASFTYRLWDGTQGSAGGYASITATGGSTAFSTATQTASINVVGSLGTTAPLFIGTQSNRLFQAPLNRTTGQSADPFNLFGINEDYSATDIELSPDGTKLYWLSGSNADKILSSNADGSNVQAILAGEVTYGTGLAVSADKIFYADYSTGFFSANLDGSNKTSLTGPGKIDASDLADISDIEYANNKIYFMYKSNSTGLYRILSANTDGSSPTEIYAGAQYIKGLYVTATHVYWTETDGSVVPNSTAVKKIPLAGGTAQTLATLTDRFFQNLVVDEASATVYVVAADVNNSVAVSELRKVSTNGGALSTVLSLYGQATSLALGAASSTLPVSLLRYDARLLPNRTGEISWTTAAESANSHFIIEKSYDGRTYSAVATVAAKGTPTAATAYTWVDTKLAAGDNYYRLLQVDLDGRKKDLGIRRLYLAPSGKLGVYPNPATGATVTVNLGYAPAGTQTYRLLDATGRAVARGTLSQQQQTISLGGLPAGYYVLHVSDGQHVQLTVK